MLQDAQASATGVLPGVRQHGAVSGTCMSRCMCKGRCIFVREPVPRKERDWEKKPEYLKKSPISQPCEHVAGQDTVTYHLRAAGCVLATEREAVAR